ncbi:MAG: hypothetical protein K9K65_17960 [Desulfarculaceae bacterium]|nr:hypothetical protein [Desulfarculaceae bacterium]MCF8124356.1 hypothetical protein [Desulfarculaceae bacterium]
MRYFTLALLVSAALCLSPLAASAAQLVLKNQCENPVTVTVISPCGKNETILVQVDAQSSLGYETPACPGGTKVRDLRLAVFDKRSDAPGFIAMSIAAKADVEPPAEVIITRQDCEECDTIYKIKWLPLKEK